MADAAQAKPERVGPERAVNQDIPHDWTEWFDTEPPDHPLSELSPDERAAAEKNAKTHAKAIEEYRAQQREPA